jgi:uncharacterized protein YecT (DUF1311 family)
MRLGYNGCEEGTEHGAIRCAQLHYYLADASLNSAWRKLLNASPANTRNELIGAQRVWLKSVGKACTCNNEEEWNSSWVFAFETRCEGDKLFERASEFQKLEDCFKSGTSKCASLSKAP